MSQYFIEVYGHMFQMQNTVYRRKYRPLLWNWIYDGNRNSRIPRIFTYKSTFEDLVEFPKTEQSSDELRKLINEVLQDQEVIVGLSQIPNKKQKNVDYILKPKKKSTFSVTKKNDSPVENNPKKEMNGTITQKFDNHEDHSTEDNKDEQ